MLVGKRVQAVNHGLRGVCAGAGCCGPGSYRRLADSHEVQAFQFVVLGDGIYRELPHFCLLVSAAAQHKFIFVVDPTFFFVENYFAACFTEFLG